MDLKWVQIYHSPTPSTSNFACPQVNQERNNFKQVSAIVLDDAYHINAI